MPEITLKVTQATISSTTIRTPRRRLRGGAEPAEGRLLAHAPGLRDHGGGGGGRRAAERVARRHRGRRRALGRGLLRRRLLRGGRRLRRLRA